MNKIPLSQFISSAKGQVSIFFSTTILVMITFIAFIINIGIFVKAKINLQNATDAAAYAGASVQARQLTNIAYMNWEMRNVYKEWMFKYYVLGGLNLPNVAGANSGGQMDFTMLSYTRAKSAAIDKYNFPSVCVDFANTGGVGMCTRYLVPGLPRFESSNVLGMDETTNAFVDTIVSEKSKACSVRSKINFFTANTWAYNVKTNDTSLKNITEEAPEIAANFMGAFPNAFEMGLRIRNLESQVNHPPQGSICIDPGTGVNCNTSVNGFNSPSKERALKAFMSGWRNIGSNGEDNPLMKNSFTLTEVSPTLDSNVKVKNSLSTLLIPDGSNASNKYYLDLKLMTLNYATFYTAFTTTKGGIKVTSSDPVSSEGQCNATKVGLPVPGYPLGFVKNPDFLTYYAVQGKAKFIGLFNPFGKEIILSAYAAAKPFGGRIGPMTFDVSDTSKITPREKQKSSPFITALNTGSFLGTFGTALASGQLYAPGMPIPINAGSDEDNFWLTGPTDTVGGWIPGKKIFYGIPNILYDYPGNSISSNSAYYSGTENIQIIARTGIGATPSAGLYNSDMFSKFKANLRNIGGVVSSQDINDGILAARAPTLYEAHNYLIPTPEDLNEKVGTDSWGIITGEKTGLTINSKSYSVYNLSLYAPIYSSDSIYKGPGELISVFDKYIENQEQAVLKYRNSMNLVAADIYNNNKSGATGQNTGESAAAALSDLLPSQYAAISASPAAASDPSAKPTCKSIAGKFMYFYTGKIDFINSPANDPNCSTSLRDLLSSRWNDSSLVGDTYNSQFALPDNFNEELFSAYRPGPEHDAGPSNGVVTNPLTGKTDKMVRNFYSTKFIPMKSVGFGSSGAYNPSSMLIYSEGHGKSISSEAKRKNFSNPIDASTLSIDINKTTH